MLKCWKIDPNERPSFSTLVNSISGFAEITAGYSDVSITTTPLKQIYPLPPQVNRTVIYKQKRNATLMLGVPWTTLQLKSMCSARLKMKAAVMIHFCENLCVLLNISACYCVVNLLFYIVLEFEIGIYFLSCTSSACIIHLMLLS